MKFGYHPLAYLVAVFGRFGQFCYLDLRKIKKRQETGLNHQDFS
jgi:hypothetical protein